MILIKKCSVISLILSLKENNFYGRAKERNWDRNWRFHSRHAQFFFACGDKRSQKDNQETLKTFPRIKILFSDLIKREGKKKINKEVISTEKLFGVNHIEFIDNKYLEIKNYWVSGGAMVITNLWRRGQACDWSFLKNQKTRYSASCEAPPWWLPHWVKFRIFSSLERWKQHFRDKNTKIFTVRKV